MKKKLTILFVVCSFGLQSIAQDVRFTQFYTAPMHVNPALVGVFDGGTRITLGYREQYSSLLQSEAFKSATLGADWRIPVKRKGDFLGVGACALRDQVGTSQFTLTNGALNLSFGKQLAGGKKARQYLVAGAQAGYNNRSINWDNLWYSQQFDTRALAIDRTLASGEGFSGVSSGNYLDVNAGLLWYLRASETQSVYIGASYYHLNNPDVSLHDDMKQTMPRRWVGHAGGEVPIHKTFSVLPAVVVMGQGGALSTALGANLRYTALGWHETAIRLGFWGHAAHHVDKTFGPEAFSVATVLEMPRWKLGISYDFTISALSSANKGRGAYEVTFMYVSPGKTKQPVDCPRF